MVEENEWNRKNPRPLGVFSQPGVLSPTDRVPAIQGERQFPSWPWTNNEENQDTFLSMVMMAPARVEEAGFSDGSHHVLSTLALVTLSPGAQVRTAPAHQSWRCPALTYVPSPTTALLNQIICMPRSIQLNLSSTLFITGDVLHCRRTGGTPSIQLMTPTDHNAKKASCFYATLHFMALINTGVYSESKSSKAVSYLTQLSPVEGFQWMWRLRDGFLLQSGATGAEGGCWRGWHPHAEERWCSWWRRRSSWWRWWGRRRGTAGERQRRWQRWQILRHVRRGQS